MASWKCKRDVSAPRVLTPRMSENHAPITQAALAGISHGTSSVQGQLVVRVLAARTQQLAAEMASVTETTLGHVDVQQPDVSATLDALAPESPAVLVPLLLSTGYHVTVDMQQAAAASPRRTQVATALGPDPRLAEILAQRLLQAGAVPGEDVIVLGAAGSSTPGAVTDVQATARLLSETLGAPVEDCYLAFAQPSVAEAVEQARQQWPGRRVVIASYLLAPGYFQRLMTRQGADLVTEPLLCLRDGAPDVPDGLPEIVIDRFQHALSQL